jgi:superfamily I DNA/RNA helicase
MIQFLPLAMEADITRRGNKTSGPEAITLTTIHAAKGLEFPVVYIVGVEEGLLPFGEDSDAEAIAEEQRLFYVGLTRARQYLYLVNAQYRFHQGEPVPTQVSRFLKMIPSELIEKVEWNQQNRAMKQLELFI